MAQSGTQQGRKVELVDGNFLALEGHSLASLPTFVPFAERAKRHLLSYYQNSYLPGQEEDAWNNMLRYFMWEFTYAPDRSFYISPAFYPTWQEMFQKILDTMPVDGLGNLLGGVFCNIYEVIDEKDTFPSRHMARNSLISSIQGRGKWLTGVSNDKWGVSPGFNAGEYYLNYANDLGRALVNFIYSTDPGTNNDGVIWFQRRSKNNWHSVHSFVNLNDAANLRGAVYDVPGNIWVSPAPQNTYDVVNRLMLSENKKNRILLIESSAKAKGNVNLQYGVGAHVLVVSSGTQVGFVLTPAGFDTLYTDYIDSSKYKLLVRVRYRRGWSTRYGILEKNRVLPITGGDGSNISEFSLIDPYGSRDNLLFRQTDLRYSPDLDRIPIGFDICRMDTSKKPYVRSPWVRAGRTDRRLPQAPVVMNPAFR